jgi:O-antigen biosynthesis protein
MISIFTPTHRDGTFLIETWESLKEQTMPEWQWVLVPNGNGVVPDVIKEDPRVKIVPFNGSQMVDGRCSIGELKRFACENCDGDIFVELDDDDLLTINALEKIAAAFANKKVQMVYSNTTEFWDKTWKPRIYSSYWGWKTRPFFYKDHPLIELLQWEPCPQAFRHIFWTPNHVRAYRASAYWKLGGHNSELAVVDDHDLNLRFYIAYGDKGLKHIDETLYLYRVHQGSTCIQHGKDIAGIDMSCYNKYIVQMAERWCIDNTYPKVDLGGSFNSPAGYLTVDLREGATIQSDLNNKWPFEDSMLGIVRASHIFEHLKDPIHTMNELYRVLVPGGFAFIEVPSTDGRGAFQDPTHVSFWNQNSFLYYTTKNQAQYIQPQSKSRFQISMIDTLYPNKWFEDNKIPCVRAHLICLKPGYEERRAGEVLI